MKDSKQNLAWAAVAAVALSLFALFRRKGRTVNVPLERAPDLQDCPGTRRRAKKHTKSTASTLSASESRKSTPPRRRGSQASIAVSPTSSVYSTPRAPVAASSPDSESMVQHTPSARSVAQTPRTPRENSTQTFYALLEVYRKVGDTPIREAERADEGGAHIDDRPSPHTRTALQPQASPREGQGGGGGEASGGADAAAAAAAAHSRRRGPTRTSRGQSFSSYKRRARRSAAGGSRTMSADEWYSDADTDLSAGVRHVDSDEEPQSDRSTRSVPPRPSMSRTRRRKNTRRPRLNSTSKTRWPTHTDLTLMPPTVPSPSMSATERLEILKGASSPLCKEHTAQQDTQ